MSDKKTVAEEQLEQETAKLAEKERLEAEKKARKEAEERMPEVEEKGTIFMTCEHEFTEAEMKNLNKTLALKIPELRRKENQKKAAMSQFNSEIESIQGTITKLSEDINNGTDQRELECKIVYRWKEGLRQIIHPETQEIVSETQITDREKQLELDIILGKEKPKTDQQEELGLDEKNNEESFDDEQD